jgi:hypothetical protein
MYAEGDGLWEEERPTDDIAEYYEEDEDLPDEVPNFDDEDLGYVDFLGIDDILLDYHNNDSNEFYADEENYMFTSEATTNPFLSIFMACGREKGQGKHGKPKVLQGEVWDLQNNHHNLPMIKSIMFVVRFYLVLILRKGEWNKLIRHPKDHGKDSPNSRANSLQPRVNDVDR